MDIFVIFLKVIIIFIAIKSMTIGSDFNFYLFFKHRSAYIKYYDSRQTFEQHLIESEDK